MDKAFDRFNDMTLDQYKPGTEQQREALQTVSGYIDHLAEARRSGRGLTLVGPAGVGKTMLACIVLSCAKAAGYRIEAIEMAIYIRLFYRRLDLMNLVRAGNEEAADRWLSLDEHLNRILGSVRRRADFVLFDDVGKEYETASGWNESQFNEVLRFRCNRCLPFLLTSNLPLSEWAGRYNEELASLLVEVTDIVVVTGDDYRLNLSSPWSAGS